MIKLTRTKPTCSGIYIYMPEDESNARIVYVREFNGLIAVAFVDNCNDMKPVSELNGYWTAFQFELSEEGADTAVGPTDFWELIQTC